MNRRKGSGYPLLGLPCPGGVLGRPGNLDLKSHRFDRIEMPLSIILPQQNT